MAPSTGCRGRRPTPGATPPGLGGQDRRIRRQPAPAATARRGEGGHRSTLPSAVVRSRVSPRRRQNSSQTAWACSTVTSSGRVRHQRCAAVWLDFSTTPLRLPATAAGRSPPTPRSASPPRRSVARHPPGFGMTDRGHPVEAPHPRHPAQGRGRPGRGRRRGAAGSSTGRARRATARSGPATPTNRCAVDAPSPRRRRVGQIQPVPLRLFAWQGAR